MPTYKPKYPSQLPATPCPADMRENMIKIAEKKGESLAQIQRNAFALFLAQNVTNCNSDDALGSDKEQAVQQ